ncbi:hypothetical protein GCM10022422_19920 [Flavobacterium ginsengisoli]|uniref:Uncharacterized protein n=1 Tax=Flavobacterium ginsengisoli TaxID=871694 RepID=A0ABP7FFD5_9FLAO
MDLLGQALLLNGKLIHLTLYLEPASYWEQVFLYIYVRLSGVEAYFPVGTPFDSAQWDKTLTIVCDGFLFVRLGGVEAHIPIGTFFYLMI